MRTARASSDAAQEGHSSNTQNHDSGRSWASTCQAAVTDPRDESGLWVAVQEQHLSPALLHYGSCSSSQCIWLFLLPRLPWRKVLLELRIPRLKRLLYLEHSRSDLNRTSNSQVSLAPSSRPSPRSRGNAVAPTGQATSPWAAAHTDTAVQKRLHLRTPKKQDLLPTACPTSKEASGKHGGSSSSMSCREGFSVVGRAEPPTEWRLSTLPRQHQHSEALGTKRWVPGLWLLGKGAGWVLVGQPQPFLSRAISG